MRLFIYVVLCYVPTRLAKLVNDQEFVSKKGKSNHALWYELCELISKNPHQIKSLNVDAILRSGLRRYTDQVWPLTHIFLFPFL